MRFATLLASGLLALPNPARSQRSLLADLGYSRLLQKYRRRLGHGIYSALAAMGDESLGEDFDDLPLVYKVAHKSLAYYCAVLGGGEDCCVGEEAEVPGRGYDEDG